MNENDTIREIKLALPKGQMKDNVLLLLADAGIKVKMGSRNYRPRLSIPGYEVKMLKPQNIVEMLHHGSRDIGFAGADWVQELGADLVELLDTELDPVRIVAAVPKEIEQDFKLQKKSIVVASEYEQLTKNWIKAENLNAEFVRSYGATEVFPPEDADCIVDNTATGSTLLANDLAIIDELLSSSTRLYANPEALQNKHIKAEIDRLVMLIKSVLEARKRVMIEVNVPVDCLDMVVKLLPSMRQPTISPLYKTEGFAVKAAVLRSELPKLIPAIKAVGATDVVVMIPNQLIP